MNVTLFNFLTGAVCMGFGLSGLFFLRFWKKTQDSLFLAFAVAFWLLCVAQAMLAFTDMPVEERSWIYLLRLLAFLTILWAVARKNRS